MSENPQGGHVWGSMGKAGPDPMPLVLPLLCTWGRNQMLIFRANENSGRQNPELGEAGGEHPPAIQTDI